MISVGNIRKENIIRMPMNGQNEILTYGFDSTPLFTYTMIGLTTIVIAYATMTDDGDNLPDFLKSSYTDATAVGGSHPVQNNSTNAILNKNKKKNRKTIRKR